MDPLIGSRLGKYELLERLGAGGMGAVYRSHHPQLNRPVAIKILPDTIGHDESFRQRFLREGQAMAALNHPNIIRVYDVDEVDGMYYMVVDYIEGGSLAQRLESGTPMGFYWACDLVARVAEALDYAHRKSVIHRDIKPANILLTAEDDPIIADFGIAKLLQQAEGENLTVVGSVVGTPAYMAPEQILGGDVDGRSDLYSLGIVFYQLLTGRQPFTGDTMNVITQQINTLPTAPRIFTPDLPGPLEEIVLQSLQKLPQHRFGNGKAFANAIRTAIREVGPQGFLRATPAAAAAVAVQEVQAPPQQKQSARAALRSALREDRKRLARSIAVALVVLFFVWQIVKALFVPILILSIIGGLAYLYRRGRQLNAQATLAPAQEHINTGELLQHGLRHYREGQFSEAMALFTQVLEHEPSNVDALISRGLALYTLGNLQDAGADFDAALAVAPRHPRALYQRALLHQALDRPQTAAADLEQVLAIIPPQAQLRREAEARLKALSGRSPGTGELPPLPEDQQVTAPLQQASGGAVDDTLVADTPPIPPKADPTLIAGQPFQHGGDATLLSAPVPEDATIIGAPQQEDATIIGAPQQEDATIIGAPQQEDATIIGAPQQQSEK